MYSAHRSCLSRRFTSDGVTSLGSLIALFYVTSLLFFVVVLGSVMLYMRLNIFHMLRYLREELLIIPECVQTVIPHSRAAANRQNQNCG